MHDCIHTIERRGNAVCGADIPLHKLDASKIARRCRGGPVDLFSQGIQDTDGVTGADQSLDEMTTDEPGTPGYQDVHPSRHRGVDAIITVTPPRGRTASTASSRRTYATTLAEWK
jgi:hypothetical protein